MDIAAIAIHITVAEVVVIVVVLAILSIVRSTVVIVAMVSHSCSCESTKPNVLES